MTTPAVNSNPTVDKAGTPGIAEVARLSCNVLSFWML